MQEAQPPTPAAERLHIERLIGSHEVDTLATDVRRGLACEPKWLASKHLYAEGGGELFEQICLLPEYYPTRTERVLLERHAADIVALAGARCLVELGSGSSRKTRLLLDALGRRAGSALYVPVDLDEATLRGSAGELLEAYPWLRVHGLVADLERPLERLPKGRQVLVAFLGGTIGNFGPEDAARLLGGLASATGAGATLLLGTDMDKDPGRLAAAYDDSRGVTARFNLNVLRVINCRLGGTFNLARFEHLAFYDRVAKQIEMHLRSRVAQTVRIERLGMEVSFRAGETVRTEISRKFTPESARAMLEGAGFEPLERFAPSSGDFYLWLARAHGARGAAD
ncbi:MAG TPA: L-histidine N(alpha)-methyltransferase [Myxococcales bacterium]|jgi:L-histidine N-alpha-methyltransferase|nr:L-histidine N(alpha)-methyltransferase [Myxococcales bacterium]